MCIILNAVKKRHVKRGEVVESMKVNSSGFFMAALKADGSRDTIRTLDEKEAMKFFDEKVGDDDHFVMHARIPSRGEKTLENVHGWESDGILFMHNMTLGDLDKMMKNVDWKGTDSEFFFRKIFIPYYRGMGAEAYKDGKFHKDLDNLIDHFCGYSNKFCFIMPDNRVIMYGNWVKEEDRKENGECAFYASNSGYRLVYGGYGGYAGYSGSYGGYTAKGGTAAGAAGFRRGETEYDDEYYYGCGQYGGAWSNYGSGYRGRSGKQKKPKSGKSETAAASAAAVAAAATEASEEEKNFSGKVLLNVEGVEGVCSLALRHLVLENTITCRYLYSENETEKAVETAMRGTLPRCFEEAKNTLFAELKNLIEAAEAAYEDDSFSGEKAEELAAKFAARMAKAYEKPLVKVKTPAAYLATEWSVQIGLKAVKERLDVLERLLNVSIDLAVDEPEAMAQAFVMVEAATSSYCDMEEMAATDLISTDSMTVAQAPEVVQLLLRVVNGATGRYDAEIQTTMDRLHAEAGSGAEAETAEGATLEELADGVDSLDGLDSLNAADAAEAAASREAEELDIEDDGTVVLEREDFEADAATEAAETEEAEAEPAADVTSIPQIDWANHKKKEGHNDSGTSVYA